MPDTAATPPDPLALLLRVNALSAWRRLKSIRDQSRLLTAVIACFIGSYLVLAFWLFFAGLRFLSRFPGLGPALTERLMFLLFAFLFVLLLLSNLVISYTNLFRNRETAFLLTMPIGTTRIFQWKLIESTVLASWAFLFLIAPFLAAYGMIKDVAWHFYPMTVLMVALYIVLPAVLGAFLAVSLGRYLDRRLFQVVMITILVAALAALAWWFRPEGPPPEDSTETRAFAVLDQMLGRTKFADWPLLPSQWLASSVLQWADGALRGSGFLVLVLLSYALFFGMLAFTRMGRLFYDASSAVHSRASVLGRWRWFQVWRRRECQRGPRLGPGVLDALADLIPGLSPDVRALMVKDTRTFWRDTTQWAQSLVLFGLLAAYIFNLRHFSQQLGNPFWTNLVSYLNLGACSLNLATLTTRFVYPQFSLEGKRLWIVGMAPLGLVRVVKAKYGLATATSLLVTLGLILVSCYMLKLPPGQTAYFGLAITTMTFTLNGLAVGLGVLFPNFKEDNPGKIVSGFGGTFCLVLSFLYIVGSVCLLALATPWSQEGTLSARTLLCVGGFLGLSIALGWIPLVLGLRRVRSFEL
ncbi:MAG TPA: hypothetical protein VNO52_04725 [Methylomirabilota bacterium]|nr:hypothetical protein [Methylomirabilota bacterium]